MSGIWSPRAFSGITSSARTYVSVSAFSISPATTPTFAFLATTVRNRPARHRIISIYARIGAGTTPIDQLNTTVNAKLFWGVFLTNNTNINSGNRYNITTGTDDNGDGVFNDRPAGYVRNAGDGPRFVNFNFNISKAFFIGAKADAGKSGGGGGGGSTVP